ncbi:uncharacterized protein SPPG_03079 [Spizellomyces punctatus DAOM BR117]|uniref:Uncharacterized protein n=1 Tax=Spizellomyces punctatus (strain DAOM BR117) TaxID=645134 RepID=A0A0L0HKB7_SPIPD|nr:uncharacterized protein SPPG_03079 [Spizellomyces punctatus DAOM BR117]KND01269.1 hypothetical protein SPPG_03079 [Spizellomyces punctatus DAOM BR117]|eukprot:XP_016609308.1 hypothetical protein SPPG_03079 [Spizellomyces punctatus DAOM BR117]
MSCEPLDLFHIAPTSIVNDWYITNECGNSYARVALYSVNLIIFGGSTVVAIALIPFNLRENRNWFRTDIARVLLTSLAISIAYTLTYLAVLLQLPASISIICWWLAFNIGNAFQLSIAYVWIVPIRSCKYFDSEDQNFVNRFLLSLQYVRFLIFASSIVFNIIVVSFHVSYYNAGNARMVFVTHTIFNAGALGVVIAFASLFVFSCKRLRTVLQKNLDDTQYLGGGSLPQHKLHLQNLIILLTKSIKITITSAALVAITQLIILVWAIVARSPGGMNGVVYVYAIRSMAVAGSIVPGIYLYGYEKVIEARKTRELDQQSSGQIAALPDLRTLPGRSEAK